MSLISLFVAARSALARHRERRHALEGLMALDDRSLADIGIHRSQIATLAQGVDEAIWQDPAPSALATAGFHNDGSRFSPAHRLLPRV